MIGLTGYGLRAIMLRVLTYLQGLSGLRPQ